MPTDTLDFVFDCAVLEKSLNRSTLTMSFLVWLPENDVQDYLKNTKQRVEEESRNDTLSDQLIQTELFRHSKQELSNICKKNPLNTTVTKLLLNADEDLYSGDIESLPSRSYELRNIGNLMEKQNAILLKDVYSVTKCELKMSLL